MGRTLAQELRYRDPDLNNPEEVRVFREQLPNTVPPHVIDSVVSSPPRGLGLNKTPLFKEPLTVNVYSAEKLGSASDLFYKILQRVKNVVAQQVSTGRFPFLAIRLKRNALEAQLDADRLSSQLFETGAANNDDLLKDVKQKRIAAAKAHLAVAAAQSKDIFSNIGNSKSTLEQNHHFFKTLLTRRLHEAEFLALSHPARLRELVQLHQPLLARLGVIGERQRLPRDFKKLKQFYGELVAAKETLAKKQSALQAEQLEIKSKLSAAIQQQDQSSIRLFQKKLERSKAHLTALKPLQASVRNQKTINALYEQLISRNSFAQEHLDSALEQFNLANGIGSKPVVVLEFDFKPSLRDAFAGWISKNCVKDREASSAISHFSNPDAHCAKVWAVKNGERSELVGMAYLIDRRKSLGRALHSDVLELPGITSYAPDVVRAVFDALADRAFKHGFERITAAKSVAFQSTHGVIKEGFKKVFPEPPGSGTSLPREFKNFQSQGDSHVILVEKQARR